MSNRIRSRLPIGLALLSAAGIAAIAGTGSPEHDPLKLIAPTSVIAGNPISGYVVGGLPVLTLSAFDMAGAGMPGSPTTSAVTPFFFSYPTFEPMAGSVVNILVTDTDPASETASVFVQ